MHVLAGGLVLGHCISLLYSCTAVPVAVWVHLAHGSCNCGVVSTSLYTLYTPYAVRYANNVRLTLYYYVVPDEHRRPPPIPLGPGFAGAKRNNQLYDHRLSRHSDLSVSPRDIYLSQILRLRERRVVQRSLLSGHGASRNADSNGQAQGT